MLSISGAVVAEWRKITSTRAWWILLVCVAVLAAGYAALPAAVALIAPSTPGPAFGDLGTMLSVFHGGNPLTRILALVVGVMIMGGEYRHRTITLTYLAVPRRGRVALAKACVALLIGLAYGLVSVIMGLLVAVIFVTWQGGSLFLDRPEAWRSLGLGVLSIGLWTVLGFGLGVLIRSMVLAMIIGIGFAYLVEPSLSLLFSVQGWDTALNLMPTGATNAALGLTSPILFPSSDPFAWWQALLVLTAWAVVPAVLGVAVTARRDVS